MGDVNRTLTPGESQTLAITGRMIYVKNASAPFVIAFGAERYRVQQGDKIDHGSRFEQFRIDDVGGAGVDLTLVVSNGDFSQSVIAQAVRVTNDGGQPLPVNIAGQSLPDRPYLRANQTFSVGVQTDYRYASTFVLVNPTSNNVCMIDPIIVATMTRDFILRMVVADITSENGFSAFKHGSNKKLTCKEASKIYIQFLSNLIYGSGDVRHPQNALTGSISNILLSYVSRSSNGIAKIESNHGGFAVPPGTILAIQSEPLYGDSAISDAERTHATFDWIEQPLNA